MDCAVVSTSIGAEGLPVESEKHLLLRDAPFEFAESILELLTSRERRSSMGIEAGRLVNASFGAESVARQFQQICEACVGTKTTRQTSSSPLKNGIPGTMFRRLLVELV
jgi:hypothetical protein